jgi:hypothetical protein
MRSCFDGTSVSGFLGAGWCFRLKLKPSLYFLSSHFPLSSVVGQQLPKIYPWARCKGMGGSLLRPSRPHTARGKRKHKRGFPARRGQELIRRRLGEK